MFIFDLITFLQALFFGLIEGITEWLPVSSTGHLILLQELVSLDVSKEFWDLFLVVIQLGAILAICSLYFTQLNPWSRKKDVSARRGTWLTWAKIIVGVLPAAVAGVLLDDFMEEHLSTWSVVSAALIVYGIVFIVLESVRARRIRCGLPPLSLGPAPVYGEHFADAPAQVLPTPVDADAGADTATGTESTAAQTDPGLQSMSDLSFGRALAIGCFQVLSLVPGTSRSGSTILGGLLLGCSRTLAAQFSFYMAIPVMFGASALRLVKFVLAGNSFSSNELFILLVGMISAYLTSVFTVKLLMKFIRKHDFSSFGVYRVVLGIAVIAYFVLPH